MVIDMDDLIQRWLQIATTFTMRMLSHDWENPLNFLIFQYHFSVHQIENNMKTASSMQTATNPKFTYWQEGDFWLGYLEEFPDYMTQGSSFEDLKEHLIDLYKDLSGGKIPSARRVDVLDIF